MKIKKTLVSGLTIACMIIGVAAVSDMDANSHNLETSSHDIVAVVQGGITVTVTDAATGEPIQGAEIRLEGTDTSERTNNNGTASFSDLEAGEHTFAVSANGYSSAEETIEVEDGTEEVQIRLESERETQREPQQREPQQREPETY